MSNAGDYELCACDGIHTYCDLCGPVVHRSASGPCPECARPADVQRTHLHLASTRKVYRVNGLSQVYTRE